MLTVARKPRRLRRLGLVLVALVPITAGAASTANASHYLGLHLAQLSGHSQPAIHFIDYTDSTWPVGAAATEWDRSSYLTVGRSTGCPSSPEYCPTVNQVNNSNYYGQVTFYSNGGTANHLSTSGMVVRLSNQTPLSGRRSVACQELGHLLGLDHRGVKSSCMWDKDLTTFPNYPDGHDFDQLSYIYAHSN